MYQTDGYVIDPHTAVAASVYEKYKAQTGDTHQTVIVSTASPFKFTRSVMCAIDTAYDAKTDFELADELSKLAQIQIPKAVEEIRTAPVLHETECEISQMQAVVKQFLGV